MTEQNHNSLRSDDLSHPAVGWQPIATAPRDGTMILTIGGRREQPTLEMSDGEYWNGSHPARSSFPTHWMPLPAAPTDQQAWSGGRPEVGANQNPPIPDHVEAVARMISPDAFKPHGPGRRTPRADRADLRERARGKARDILALLWLNGRS